MDANNNATSKYRRESLNSETDNSLSFEQEPQNLSNSFKYYLFGLTASIYLIYVSDFLELSSNSPPKLATPKVRHPQKLATPKS